MINFLSTSFILCSFFTLISVANSETIPPGNIKILEEKIKYLSTNNKEYRCSNSRKDTCEKILKSKNKSLSMLSTMKKNKPAVQARIDNIHK